MTTDPKLYDRWLPFVKMFSRANELGRQISASSSTQQNCDACPRQPETATSLSTALCPQSSVFCPLPAAPRILLCSPHPDDEILTGALPLRLLQEENATVINLAVTLGSNENRKADRLRELRAACQVSGFHCRLAAKPLALDQINPTARHLPDWPAKVAIMANILNDTHPDIIFLPHAHDNHPTHQGVHFLVLDALTAGWNKLAELIIIETEFWQPMQNPNLLIGLKNEDLALLLAALSKHEGEIARNPYHLSQPARMMDNVRRGREITGKHNCRADFLFGELYRVSRWQNSKLNRVNSPMIIGPHDSWEPVLES